MEVGAAFEAWGSVAGGEVGGVGLDIDICRESPGGFVDEGEVHPDCAAGDIGIGLDVFDVEGIVGGEFDGADDAVPVALGMVANAVGVFADLDTDAVIDAESNAMVAGFELAGDVVDVRGGEAISVADGGSIDPEGGFPVATFEGEVDMFSFPVLRDEDVFLVPAGSDIMGAGCEPEGEFDVAGLAVGGVEGAGEVGFVLQGAGPFGFGGYGIAVALGEEGAWQADDAGEFEVEPFFLEALVAGVHLEVPVAGEGDFDWWAFGDGGAGEGARGAGCRCGQQQSGGSEQDEVRLFAEKSLHKPLILLMSA